MGIGDDIRHGAEKLGGKIKEGVGRATDNQELEDEGRGDQAKADAKKAVDDAKDAVKDAADGAKNAASNARDAFER